MIIANKYHVIEELGRGGMGVVYKVRHLRLNSVFALKMLHSALAVDRELVMRFHREAKIMAGLHHPNIVRIFDIDQDGDHHYFVMEYVPGKNLSDVLSEKGALPLDEVINIGLQVGDALAHAHAHTPPVIHRDIKPSNILIEENSNRVVLTDFGIAKLADQDQTRVTATGMIIGTIRYCAPEQIQGLPDLDARADIYSLGLVLFELFEGKKFFDETTDEAVIGKLLYSASENVPVFHKQAPRNFTKLLTKAIAKNRDHRYPSVTDLLKDLKKCRSPKQSKSAVNQKKPVRKLFFLLTVIAATLTLIALWPMIQRSIHSPQQQDSLRLKSWSPYDSKLTLKEGQRQTFSIGVEQKQGKTIRYRWTLDGNKLIGNDVTLSYQPGFDDGGNTQVLRAEASDADGKTVFKEWSLRIVDVNRSPELMGAVPDDSKVIAVDGYKRLRIEAHDPDGGSLQYLWTLDGKRLTNHSGELDLMNLEEGLHQVEVTVQDAAGAQVKKTWSVSSVPSTEPKPAADKEMFFTKTLPVADVINLNTCEKQALKTQDNQNHAYRWWINEERQSEKEKNFVFSSEQPGIFKIRVAADQDNAVIGRHWNITVASLPPPEKQVLGWLESFRQALESADIAKLVDLGYVTTPIETRSLEQTLQKRTQYQVRTVNPSLTPQNITYL